MTQTDKVLALLRERGEQGLTPLEALDLVGTFRLADNVWRAKQMIPDDHEIVTEAATSPNGKTFARYVLRRRVLPGGAEQSRLWIDDAL